MNVRINILFLTRGKSLFQEYNLYLSGKNIHNDPLKKHDRVLSNVVCVLHEILKKLYY